MPDSVRADTDQRRHGSNKAVEFLDEFTEPAEGHAIPSAQVFQAFTEWARSNGQRQWSADTFWSRAEQHAWFRNGKADRPRNPVRTSQWTIQGQQVARARLVTGLRWTDGTGPASAEDAFPGLTQ
ncbi:primase-like DNA-binding domain-containing protein [Streptomyces sp. LHD-70]|uniref:primase-like DNA-binding domain-containing protein n=1 Tax=Streptomyces sp. LHD-70 TaxID=3072140 RepID=UPI0035BE2720